MGGVPALRLRAALPIAVCGSFMLGMALPAGSASRQPSGENPAPDDRGCCILKPHPDKKAWEFHDDETRASCERMAREARMKWAFHEKHKCADFRAESQR